MKEIKIKIDDYGYLYGETKDGTIYEMVAEVYGNPYFGKIRLWKEVEAEEDKDGESIMDIGKDLQRAYDDGYEQGKQDAVKWIHVTERLPEEYKDVLCYYEYFRYGDFNCMFRTIDRGYYGNGIWGGEAGQGHKNKVLAWMPLPEPPEEE